MQREGTLPKSFYEANVTLIPKLDKYTTKKKLSVNLLNELRCKNSQYNIGTPNSTIKKHHAQQLSGFHPKDAVMVQYTQFIKCNIAR
jgi:hypothetical protein